LGPRPPTVQRVRFELTIIRIPVCLLAVATLAAAAPASAGVVYTLDGPLSAGLLAGTVTTNGALGTLSAGDIIGWNVSITYGPPLPSANLANGAGTNGYDANGYDSNGFNANGFNSNGYNQNGFDRNGYDSNGYNQNGLDRNGYDSNGYNQNGFDRNGYNALGVSWTNLHPSGYDGNGFDVNGYDANGYNHNGFDRNGFNRNGYNSNGFDSNGIGSNGLPANGLPINRFPTNVTFGPCLTCATPGGVLAALGTSSGAPPQPDGDGSTEGLNGGLYATATGLYFDFTATTGQPLYLVLGGHGDEILLRSGSVGTTGSSPGLLYVTQATSLFPEGYAATAFLPPGGPVEIAHVADVPLPPAVGLLGLALAGASCLGRARWPSYRDCPGPA
jgi:hypothetical protein